MLSLKSVCVCVCVCVCIYIYIYNLFIFGMPGLRWHAGFSELCGLLSRCDIWAQEPWDMWDLSSPTRDQTHIPYIRMTILIHWTIRKSLKSILFSYIKKSNTKKNLSKMILNLKNVWTLLWRIQIGFNPFWQPVWRQTY